MFGRNYLTQNYEILFYLRFDDYCNSFLIIHLKNNKNKFYYKSLSVMNYESTLNKLVCGLQTI